MKLFLINLDRQPDRLQRMAAMLGEAGLSFCRISAVDRERLSEDEIRRWRTDGATSRALQPGETACFLSHRECWRRIVDDALPCAAILEDDLHLAPDAGSLLRDDAWVPAEADIIKLETKLYPARVDKMPSATIGGRTLHRLRSKHAGAGGYILTREGAEKLLRMSGTFGDPVEFLCAL